MQIRTVCSRRVAATPQRKWPFLSSREALTLGRELLDSDITRLVEMNEFGFASGT